MLNFSPKKVAQSVRAPAREFTVRGAAAAKRRAIAFAAATAALAAIGVGNAASAATIAWTTNGNGNWSDPINWGGNPAPNAIDDVADFSTLDLAADATVTLDVGATVGSLIFGDTDGGVTTSAGWLIDGVNALTLATSGAGPTVTVNALGATEVARLNVTVSGTQGLTKSGVGTLVLTGSNNYTGGTTISAGTLQIGTGQAVAADVATLGAGPVTNNGTLTINKTNAITIADAIGGTGNLVKQGAANLTLSGANNYTGTTTVSGGLLTFGNAGAVSNLAAGSITVSGGGSIAYAAGAIAAPEFVTRIAGASTGALALGAGDSATNLDFTAGNLAPLGGMSVGTNTTLTYTGTVTPAGGVYRFGGGGGTLTLPNAIGGANSAVFGAGAGNTGTVILTADNTYSGTTTIAAGTLTLGAAGATGSIGAGDITNNGTLNINRSDAPLIANNITGTGNIQLTAGNPTFSGNITAGAVNASNTAGTHRVILSGPGSTYTFSALSTFNGGSGIFVNSGTANFNGGLRDDNADGGTLRVGDVTDGSTSTATAVLNVTDIHIQRNGGTANSTGDFTSGIQVGRGGTLNATTMRLGINNSNGALSIGIVGQPAGQGGTVNVSGALTLGEQSSGDRGGHMRVLDGGILNVPDTAQGLVIVRRTTGDAANQRSNATFAGNSVSTVGKIWFGFTADPVGLPITGGSSRLHMTGGNLYVGAGGMSWGGSGTHEATMNMTSGVYGAAANHIVDSGITFNLNAPVGTPFTIRAADAAGVAQNITLNNRLIGAGPLLKTGDGTLALYGPNTHTGPTTVSAGVLQGKGSSLRNAITNNATVRFDDAAGVSTFAGVISGPGAVDKIGLGTTVFNAGQTYTGATTISQGVLRFAGAHTTTSGVTVGNGGGLGATAGGATIPTLTLGSAGGDALTFSTNDGSGINALNVTNLNGLVANGLTTVELGSTGVTSGTFTLIDYNGAIGGGGFSPSTFTLGTLPPRTVASLANNVANTRIEVTVTNDGPRWNGTIDNKWDTNATQNWKGSFSDTDTNFLTGDGALFDHRATGSTDVSVVGTVLPSSTTVNNPVSKNYSIGGTGNIGGSGPLIKQGDGTLTLMTTGNTFTGGTQLQGGTLVLSNENALPAAGAVTVSGGTLDLGGAPQDITGNFVVNGGTVTFGAIEKEGSAFDVRSGAVTNSVSLRGPVGLTKTTPGTFILTGNSHTYTGATTVTEGTLQLGNGVNDGNVPGNINNSGTVTFNPATEGFAWNNQVNGLTAEVVKDGPRAMFFTNVNEGNATINGGMAILIGPGGTSVVPRLGRGGRITVNNGATVLLQGAQGMGLNTANLPPSFLLNAGGTIKTDVNAEASIYNGTFAGGILSAEPGFLSLAFRGDFTTTADSTSSIIVPGPIGLNNAVGFALGANSTITIQADLTGATSLGFTGAGTAILDGDNSGVTGGVSVGDGATVEVADANRLGTTGAVTLNSGTIKTLAAINATHEIRVTGGGTINTNGFDSTFSGPTSQDGPFTKAGAGTLTVSGATGHTGATNVTGGTLVIGQSLTTSSEVSTSGDGVLSVTSDGTYNKFVNTGALTIADNSKIDLSDNKLLTSTPVGNFDGTAYTGVQGMVQRAYNFGAWDQPGLMTSQERAGFNAGPLSGTTTIGVATAEQVLFIGPTDTAVFQGQTVTGATTIAMYTYAGDLNFDGLVDGADYGVIDNYVQFPGTDGYVNGDFNYDGIIDGADYGVIDNTIQLQGAQIPGVTFGAASASSAGGLSGVTAVPEPSACGFAILGAAALLGRRRRRRRCDAAQQ